MTCHRKSSSMCVRSARNILDPNRQYNPQPGQVSRFAHRSWPDRTELLFRISLVRCSVLTTTLTLSGWNLEKSQIVISIFFPFLLIFYRSIDHIDLELALEK